ncbi:UNVERIFIED_CONTAM: hypothetical protein FKN15_008542 [Acipenser sinensis]
MESYGGKKDVWHDQKQCTNITRTCCDLSKETSDLAEGYFGRVKAVSNGMSSDWTESKRFHPKLDNTFSEWLVVIMFGCVLPSMIAFFLICVVLYLIYRYVFGNHQKPPKNLFLPVITWGCVNSSSSLYAAGKSEAGAPEKEAVGYRARGRSGAPAAAFVARGSSPEYTTRADAVEF